MIHSFDLVIMHEKLSFNSLIKLIDLFDFKKNPCNNPL